MHRLQKPSYQIWPWNFSYFPHPQQFERGLLSKDILNTFNDDELDLLDFSHPISLGRLSDATCRSAEEREKKESHLEYI